MSQKGFCVPCNRNGHSCETENMVDGQFICIFCEDDVDCPFTQRMKREQKLGDTPSKQEKSAMKTTATVAVRECGVQGCGKHLIASNRSGFCTKHFYQSKKSTSAPKVPKSPAKRTTGVTRIVEKVPEERASLSLTRAQLVALFNSWPIERQVAAVQAVFVQELSLA
jgi:hypothetical protein